MSGRMPLIICEKNNAARRIATILSNGSFSTRKIGTVPIYNFTDDSKKYGVIGLRGHITNMDYPKEFSKWT